MGIQNSPIARPAIGDRGSTDIRPNPPFDSLRSLRASASLQQSAIRNPKSAIPRSPLLAPRSSPGLTLLEVLVTMTIFLFMAGMLIMIIQQTTQAWARGERERILLERASGALDRMANDLSLACGQDPLGVDVVQARFIGDFAKDGSPRIMFVRAFEAGPERALTMTAGDGRKNELTLRPLDEEEDPKKKPKAAGNVDSEDFTGTKLGDYRALGGMAQVAWFVEKQTLYRAIRSPVGVEFTSLINPGTAAPISEDVLYFDVSYWHQAASSWDQQGKANNKFPPEKIWDSTRGITAKPLNSFILHRGAISLNDPEDDVFPSKVRITLTVDSPMPRCVNTKLTQPLTANDDRIRVQSTRGFPAGDTPDSYLLIENEWIRYKDKDAETFAVFERGARGTTAAAHDEDVVVRVGRTFTRTVFIKNYRDDWTSDKEYFAKKQKKP